MTQSPHITNSQDALGFDIDVPVVIDLPPPGAGRTRALVKTFETFLSGLSGPSAIGRAHVLAATRTALDATPAKPRQPTTAPRAPRKPTLAGALKQAAKVGKSVKGAEVYPDRIVLQFGEPSTAADINPWDEVLTNAADQKRPS